MISELTPLPVALMDHHVDSMNGNQPPRVAQAGARGGSCQFFFPGELIFAEKRAHGRPQKLELTFSLQSSILARERLTACRIAAVSPNCEIDGKGKTPV